MTSTWFLMLPCSGLAPPSSCHAYPASPLLPSVFLPSISSPVSFVFSFKTPSLSVTWSFFSLFWGGGGRDTYSTLLNFVCVCVFFSHLPNSFYWKTTGEYVKQFYFNFLKKQVRKKQMIQKTHYSPLFFFKSDIKLAQWSESVFMGLYLCFFLLKLGSRHMGICFFILFLCLKYFIITHIFFI